MFRPDTKPRLLDEATAREASETSQLSSSAKQKSDNDGKKGFQKFQFGSTTDSKNLEAALASYLEKQKKLFL